MRRNVGRGGAAMSDQVQPKRFCGNCPSHDDRRSICLLNLAYSAFVYGYSEAGDCEAHPEHPNYIAPERTQTDMMQSQTRGCAVPYFGQYITGVKP